MSQKYVSNLKASIKKSLYFFETKKILREAFFLERPSKVSIKKRLLILRQKN